MANAIPTKCPACQTDMHVRLLRCPACDTEVQGDFLLGRFALLSAEQRSFLETFIRCRGSLKEVGAQVRISYPTARNRLDSLIEALGLSETPPKSAQRITILEQLKEGMITTEQALSLLQGGKNDE